MTIDEYKGLVNFYQTRIMKLRKDLRILNLNIPAKIKEYEKELDKLYNTSLGG